MTLVAAHGGTVVDRVERLLAFKTRLTTVKGYGQLIERSYARLDLPPEPLGEQIAELNREIARLVDLVDDAEREITGGRGITPDVERRAADYRSSGS